MRSRTFIGKLRGRDSMIRRTTSDGDVSIGNIAVTCVCALLVAAFSLLFFIPALSSPFRSFIPSKYSTASRRKITALPFFVPGILTGFYKQGMSDHESLSRKLPHWPTASIFDLIRKILRLRKNTVLADFRPELKGQVIRAQ